MTQTIAAKQTMYSETELEAITDAANAIAAAFGGDAREVLQQIAVIVAKPIGEFAELVNEMPNKDDE